jgi:hypothetical protein
MDVYIAIRFRTEQEKKELVEEWKVGSLEENLGRDI